MDFEANRRVPYYRRSLSRVVPMTSPLCPIAQRLRQFGPGLPDFRSPLDQPAHH